MAQRMGEWQDFAWPAGALLGLVVGSFVATLVVRWPQDRSVLRGRSACDHCGHLLRVTELVPVLSHLAQRGRCRRCGVAIASEHLFIELSCALVGAVALWSAPGLAGLAGALFGLQLIGLAALDADHLWLPDRLTALLAATGLLAVGIDPDPLLLDRVIGGAVGFASLWLIAAGYRAMRGREGLGQGDPKLFGALGCWFGWQALPLVLLFAALLGLALALAALLRGNPVDATARHPLGSYLCIAAFPLWVVQQGGLLPG